MSGSCSARNRTSSSRPAESSAAVAWLAKTRRACMSWRDGTSRSSGSSAQMTAITLPSRSRSGTTSQCRSHAQGPRPFMTDRYMRWPGREPRHRLLVGEQEAALDLERRVEERRQLPHRERRVLVQLVERPAGRRARDEHARVAGRGAGSRPSGTRARARSRRRWPGVIASTDGVSASRDDTCSSSRSASRWWAAAASSWKLWRARATWSATATSTSSSSSDGRVPV